MLPIFPTPVRQSVLNGLTLTGSTFSKLISVKEKK